MWLRPLSFYYGCCLSLLRMMAAAEPTYQRRTCDASCLPPLRQFWTDTVTGDVAWDLAYLHHALRSTHQIEWRNLAPWARHFSEVETQIPGSRVHLKVPSCLPQHHVANTTAVIAYLWLEASVTYKERMWKRFAARTAVYADYLIKAAGLAVEAIRCPDGMSLPASDLRILTDGAVIGLVRMLPRHTTCLKLLEDHWKVLEAAHRVRNSFDADRHGSSTLSLFVSPLFSIAARWGGKDSVRL